MEPSRRNQWQSAANRPMAKPRENKRNPLPWVEEGVSGSSPEEGLKFLQMPFFCCLPRHRVAGTVS
jgi:hypothetical protein